MKIALIITICLVIMLVSCNSSNTMVNEYNAQTYNGMNNEKVLESHSVKSVDLYIREEGFYPETIVVNKGDTISINLKTHEHAIIYSDYLVFQERVKTGNIIIETNKEGTFPFYCLDCSQKISGNIIVK